MRRIALGLFVVVGCARSPRAVAPPESTKAATCPLRGEITMSAGAQLFTEPSGNAAKLRFRGWNVKVEARVAGVERAAATVWSSTGPSMRFEGFVEERELPIHAAHEIPIVRDHVVIAAGVPLHLAPGEHELRAEARYTEGLDDLFAAVACDALSFEGHAPEPSFAGTPHHLSGTSFTLYDAPSGKVVRTLKPHEPAVFHLDVHATEGAFAHVVNADWVRIDGWVKSSELAPGEAADCDDCRGGIMDADDMCLEDVPGDEDLDGCPEHGEKPGHATRAIEVRDATGHGVGAADASAKVWILERKEGRARVLPRPPVVLPVDATWWVPDDAVALD